MFRWLAAFAVLSLMPICGRTASIQIIDPSLGLAGGVQLLAGVASPLASGLGSESHMVNDSQYGEGTTVAFSLSASPATLSSSVPASSVVASVGVTAHENLTGTGNWHGTFDTSAMVDVACKGTRCGRANLSASASAYTEFLVTEPLAYSLSYDFSAVSTLASGGSQFFVQFLDDFNDLHSFSAGTSDSNTFSGVLNPGDYYLYVGFGSSGYWNGAATSGLMSAHGELDLQVTPVPIPGAVWLLGSGLFALIAVRRRSVAA